MITNNFKMFHQDFDYNGPVAIAVITSFATSVFSFFMTIEGLFFAPFILAFASVVLLGTFFLHNTNVYRYIDCYHKRALDAYDDMSDDDKKRFDFDWRSVSNLSNEDAETIADKFASVNQVSKSLAREKARFEGPVYEIKRQAAELIKERELEIHDNRKINRAIERMP